MESGEMALSIKSLPCEPEDMGSIPRTQVKKGGVWYTPVISELERKTQAHLGDSGASKPNPVIQLHARERTCIKGGGQCF